MLKKSLLILSMALCAFEGFAQKNDLKASESEAKATHKLILLKFSGSDWCIPCIQLQKTIIESDNFQQFAKDRLIILNADFPRAKKNALSKEDQEANDKLAEQYNTKGEFPFMVLLDADGKVLYQWHGFNRKLVVDDYTREIANLMK